MNKEELTRALEYTEKKHRHDTVNTFDTDISMMCVDVLKVLKNCIEIPNNATNGDVIKAMFPQIIVNNIDDMSKVYTSIPFASLKYAGANIDAVKDWWDALYKVEGSGEE